LLEKGHVVYALCRGSKDISASARLKERLNFWSAGIPSKNLIFIEGDVSAPGFGIDEDSRKKLIGEVGESFIALRLRI